MKIRSSSFNSSTVNRYTYEENHCRVTPPPPIYQCIMLSGTIFTNPLHSEVWGGGRQVDFKDYF